MFYGCFIVTPCVGVWIEIGVPVAIMSWNAMSLPAWECGLKYAVNLTQPLMNEVTPCVGVWIEIVLCQMRTVRSICHSLRGSVD